MWSALRHVFSLLPQAERPRIGKASGTEEGGINIYCSPCGLAEASLSV